MHTSTAQPAEHYYSSLSFACLLQSGLTSHYHVALPFIYMHHAIFLSLRERKREKAREGERESELFVIDRSKSSLTFLHHILILALKRFVLYPPHLIKTPSKQKLSTTFKSVSEAFKKLISKASIVFIAPLHHSLTNSTVSDNLLLFHCTSCLSLACIYLIGEGSGPFSFSLKALWFLVLHLYMKYHF